MYNSPLLQLTIRYILSLIRRVHHDIWCFMLTGIQLVNESEMLANKTFVKKTKRGAVVKVVREHYLRDDVWCGVKGCDQCKQQTPLLDTHPEIESTLCSQPHLILPDTNVVLHQMDFLEDPAITNVILLSVVLQEVSVSVCACMCTDKGGISKDNELYMLSVIVRLNADPFPSSLFKSCFHMKN